MKQRAVLAGLLVLAVAQVAAIGFTVADGPSASAVGVGTDLSGVTVRTAAGVETPLATGEPLVLLVFHSECGHCRRVAPDWKAWMSSGGGAAQAVALSPEPPSVAGAYAEEHGWDVPVWTVDAARLGGRAHALTSRTPWVFVLDARGVVVSEGHGTQLTRLAPPMSDPTDF